MDTGLATCSDSLERWYFEPRARSCSAFLYSGCAGNRNRFKTYEVCMGFCEANAGAPQAPAGSDISNGDTYQPLPSEYPSRADAEDPRA
ncbi:MAG: BPTI/Kunitz domain-containing protein, partial [bacterium]